VVLEVGFGYLFLPFLQIVFITSERCTWNHVGAKTFEISWLARTRLQIAELACL
jgi:hypothetical protein